MSKIEVMDTEISIQKVNGEDYISLTDMLKAKDGSFFIADWLRNRNTLEYIGIWEKVYNSDFNYGEFAAITNRSGLNSFKIKIPKEIDVGYALNKELLNHYIEVLGCFFVGIRHPYHFLLEPKSARKLLENYTYEWK